ncbi:MAG: N-acetylmuramoyl-L-alanine amidase [Prevotella sp.]|nr:N-acetylmuramoyl-L-alanine amidase [Prevotella sp.]
MNRICIIFLALFLISCVGVSAQNDKDTPRNGEGAQAFLKRNKRTGKACYRQFLELNKGKFGRNNSLLKKVVYTLPPLPGKQDAATRIKPAENTPTEKKHVNKLFGSKYQEYTVRSDKLKGACFYLSSGHGGPDPGAIGKVDGYELHEDEYAYDITLRLARALLEEGARVYMITQDPNDGIRDDRYLANSDRETCMGEAIPLNQLKRLKQRSDKINSLAEMTEEKYKRTAFIHVDSRSRKQKLDVFFYHAPNNAEGKRLANRMRATFESHYGKHQPRRGFAGTVSERSLHVLDNTTPVGLYAELGNIQNNFDQRRFLNPDNRQALANWMCRGFIADYENWKKGK